MPQPLADIACPVQRALARAGRIGDRVPVGRFASLVLPAMQATGIVALALRVALWWVGATAHGLAGAPAVLRAGFRPRALRGGPLDKFGGGSRLLTQQGAFDPAEFARFESFARAYPSVGGGEELGWGPAELAAYLDANNARGGGGWIRRHVIMQGEWPPLLRILGQGTGADLHMSATEVRELFEQERLPARVEARMGDLRLTDA